MLKIKNLCKRYKGFELKDVSFELPMGYIMGFIGTNGAGKSTAIKSMINFVNPSSGEIEIFGLKMPEYEAQIKEDLGIMLFGCDYYQGTKLKKIIREFRPFYKNWDDNMCNRLIKLFNLDVNKRYMELSSGMKAKFGLMLALSHNPKLLILDEPTSGLDPAARDMVLDLLREFVEDGTKSVLFSTHITSDLDKCADFIVLLENGKISINDTKDNLIDSHVVIKGGTDALNDELKSKLIGLKTNAYGFNALIKKENLPLFDKTNALSTAMPNIEDIMIYYSKEDLTKCSQ